VRQLPEAKLKTGVSGLDIVLSGGFPARSTILLHAPPGTGKSRFCKQFIREGLKEGQPCIYITTCEPVKQLIEAVSVPGVGIDNVSFIDGYSWRIPEEAAKPAPNIFALGSLTELNELTRLIKKEIDKRQIAAKGGRIVIDSLSDMLLYAEPSSVFKFLQLFEGMVKGANSVALVVLEQGLHEPQQVSTINYICNGTIYFKLEGMRRSLYVARMFNTLHPMRWIPLSLDDAGIEVTVEEFFK